MPGEGGPASWEEREADAALERERFEATGKPSWEQSSCTIEAVELPMPLDTLIKVGMLADVDGHGDGMPIEGISVTLCPKIDPAAEGSDLDVDGFDDYTPYAVASTTVSVPQIEAALLPYAVFGFGIGGWAYGRQIRRVYEKGAEHEC